MLALHRDVARVAEAAVGDEATGAVRVYASTGKLLRLLGAGLGEVKSPNEIAWDASSDVVHVVDSSAPDPDGQIEAVRTVLAEIDADQVPELIVFNKSDLAPGEAKRLAIEHPGSVAVSAMTGEGIELHFERVE